MCGMKAAAVRVNIENPKSHKALIVWRLIDEPSDNIENMKPEKSGRFGFKKFACRYTSVYE